MEEALELPDHHLHQQQAAAISSGVARVIGGESIVGSHLEPTRSFLHANRDRAGVIVIKTSTADMRERDHEPAHWLLQSIFELVAEEFPGRDVVLADGPAFRPNYRAIAQQHGWADLASRYGIDIVDLNEVLADGLLDDSVFVARLYREAACTISLAKAKTHRRTGISGAEKALIGYLSGAKMGYPKLERRHYLLPRIYEAVQAGAAPMLHIIDGHNAMEGNGPMQGTAMDTEFLLIGEDPVALDVALARLYCFDPVLVISLFHSLKSSVSHQAKAVPPTLFATDRSMTAMVDNPARPPREQPWLYRSLRREHSWRNRRAFNKIRRAFAEVGHG